jgi:hypothetical protein
VALSPGEADDRLAGKLLPRLKQGTMLLAHRGSNVDWIREIAMKNGAWANPAQKHNRNRRATRASHGAKSLVVVPISFSLCNGIGLFPALLGWPDLKCGRVTII